MCRVVKETIILTHKDNSQVISLLRMFCSTEQHTFLI